MTVTTPLGDFREDIGDAIGDGQEVVTTTLGDNIVPAMVATSALGLWGLARRLVKGIFR